MAGRPRKEINPKQILELAQIQCTLSEMAAVLDCSVDTLRDNYSALIEQGREAGKCSIRREQYKAAMKGNVTMLIWLGKNLLNQCDRAEVTLERIPDKIFVEEAQRRLELADELQDGSR